MSDEETPKTEPSTSETTNVATSSTDKATENDQQGQSTSVADPNTGALEVPEEKSLAKAVELLRLRIITSDRTNEVHVCIKATTAMNRLKRSYCRQFGFQVNELSFRFDGDLITDKDTPQSLDMINDDVIEIYQERTGCTHVI